MTLTDTQKNVLLRIATKLNDNKIAYQVTGGTAAILYGVDRETEDLDFDVAKKDIDKVREIFHESIVSDYHHYLGEDFDLWLVVAAINDVQVEFGQAEEAKILGIGNTNWTPLLNTINNAFIKEVNGVKIKVQNKNDLIEYKRILGREVDKRDVASLL